MTNDLASAMAYEAGTWFRAESVDEMQRFYRARLPAIREAARDHGYAIGVHGSERRDFDLIACPWCDGASDPDTLAHAIAIAACGITRAGAYDWTEKPLGRIAVSIPVCWTSRHDVPNDGHIDLSVCPSLDAAAGDGLFEAATRLMAALHVERITECELEKASGDMGAVFETALEGAHMQTTAAWRQCVDALGVWAAVRARDQVRSTETERLGPEGAEPGGEATRPEG